MLESFLVLLIASCHQQSPEAPRRQSRPLGDPPPVELLYETAKLPVSSVDAPGPTSWDRDAERVVPNAPVSLGFGIQGPGFGYWCFGVCQQFPGIEASSQE